MTRKEALYLLQPVMTQLQPYCNKIELAGALRRGDTHIKATTIICIPQMVKVPHQESLFGESAERVEIRDPKFCQVVDSLKNMSGTSMQLRFCRMVGDLHVFFHVVKESNWGLLLHQLSGETDYNELMRRRLETFGYRIKEDALYRNGKMVSVPDEHALYKFAQMPYSPPEMRGRLELASSR